MVKDLEKILHYENAEVIDYFLKLHPTFEGTRADAELIFKDVLRFLWLYGTIEEYKIANPDKEDFPELGISKSMIVIDNMWHTFILYTQFYTNFCIENFGQYLHHPVPLKRYYQNIEQFDKETASNIFITELVEGVVEHLGEEVAIRWFDTYFKFSPKDKTSSEHHASI